MTDPLNKSSDLNYKKIPRSLTLNNNPKPSWKKEKPPKFISKPTGKSSKQSKFILN